MKLKLMGIRLKYEIVELLRTRIEDIVHEIFHQRGGPVIEDFFELKRRLSCESSRITSQALDLSLFKKEAMDRIRYIEEMIEANRGSKPAKRSLNSRGK